MQDAISAPKVGGIVRLTRFILKGTFLIEAAGAVLLLPVFYGITKEREFGCQSFILFPLFCNAGFDILGNICKSFSFPDRVFCKCSYKCSDYASDHHRGIGFLTWDDIYTNKMKFKRYRMQSKIILVTTACLILIPISFFLHL